MRDVLGTLTPPDADFIWFGNAHVENNTPAPVTVECQIASTGLTSPDAAADWSLTVASHGTGNLVLVGPSSVPADPVRSTDASARQWPGDLQQHRSRCGSSGKLDGLIPQPAGVGGPRAISADGRFVAFTSDAPSLAPGDNDDKADVFVRDLETGETTGISLGRDDSEFGFSVVAAISGDGRFVLIVSESAFGARRRGGRLERLSPCARKQWPSSASRAGLTRRFPERSFPLTGR